MECLFGWGKSALRRQYQTIIQLLHRRLEPLHDGFLSFLCNSGLLLKEALQWRLNTEESGMFAEYMSRIENMNAISNLPYEVS